MSDRCRLGAIQLFVGLSVANFATVPDRVLTGLADRGQVGEAVSLVEEDLDTTASRALADHAVVVGRPVPARCGDLNGRRGGPHDDVTHDAPFLVLVVARTCGTVGLGTDLDAHDLTEIWTRHAHGSRPLRAIAPPRLNDVELVNLSGSEVTAGHGVFHEVPDFPALETSLHLSVLLVD